MDNFCNISKKVFNVMIKNYKQYSYNYQWIKLLVYFKNFICKFEFKNYWFRAIQILENDKLKVKELSESSVNLLVW